MHNTLNIPKIIGHRGAKGYAPENTFASFREAKARGATWVEFDVQNTKDGTLVVIHDDTLERTSNGNGIVANTPWHLIEKLDAGSWFDPTFCSERIPTFQDTILLLSELQLGANVEIKPYQNEDTKLAIAVAQVIKEMWPRALPSPLVSSFSLSSLLAVKETAPELILGVLFENLPTDWQKIAKKINAKTINIDHQVVNAEFMQLMQQENYPILTYTVNEKKRAEELFNLGVSAIFTDFPWKL